MTLALSGDSPVLNAFTELAYRLGLSPKGRERKEREETRRFAERMQATGLRERRARTLPVMLGFSLDHPLLIKIYRSCRSVMLSLRLSTS